MNTLEITIDGIKIGVDFDYQPEEKQTWDYPGCPGEVEILDVWLLSDELCTNLAEILDEKVMLRIEEKIHIGAK